jgi:hypothetical protein
MELWQTLSVILDLLVVFLTIAMFLARPRIGGLLGRGMRILVAGFLVLGLAFFSETVLFIISPISTQANEIVHRLIVGLGFVFIIGGFIMMRRAFD